MRVRFGECSFDLVTRELCRGGRPVPLAPKSFHLLSLLIERRPRPLAHAELRDALWPDTHVGYTSLARVVAEVRKAIGDGRRANLVRTVPRFGYAFAGTVVVEGKPVAAPGLATLVCGEREFPLGEGDTLVGRGPQCEVRITSSEVSRAHARIHVDATGATIEDLGSKNGTWVNGERRQGAVELADRDELAFGTLRAVFRLSSATESTRSSRRAP
jgi:DNA-binding winged helix-turn-helix (wHTH) protein